MTDYSTSGEPRSGQERNDSDQGQEAAVGRVYERENQPSPRHGPDVHLNVPVLKVDEISLEVDNLEAHVSLVAQVLDMLKLNVGADVYLGKVDLEIKGVEAEAQLDVRLDNVAVIVNRVLTTLDQNPEILRHIGRGVESATRHIGAGTGSAVGELGKGAGSAVQDVGEGAGGAVRDVGKGAGGAVEDVGMGAGSAVQDVGAGAADTARDVGKGAGSAAEGAGEAAKGVAGTAPAETGKADDTGGTAEAGKPAGEDADVSEGRDDAEPAADQDDTDGGEDEGGDVQNALREAEESVRDLGRALLRMVRG
ncbi:hypothetical protein E1281_07585 [Actinomadura sp. KC345]|uniref:hypothetical protein n=1 Tax=Actinomadura sp. KC345 TaxID=2530371 RepID=UPI001048CC2F|nr:hypothetical protein [Actinomadura sp. KC345]TDC56348.1 hypothetical protein E1281_07585 [Actinomadura sp. KC345]